MKNRDCCDGFGQEEPGFFDSLFSDSSTQPPAGSEDPSYVVPETPLVLAPELQPAPPNPLDQYSTYFKLADLTVTSLPYPNLPLDTLTQSNLRKLAACLDAIHDQIGAFAIASAYRSPENQDALRSGAQGGAASHMAVKKSYHSQGLAADLTPENGMTPTQFAQAIYNNPITNALCGQIVDKSEGGQHSLHISIRTPKFTIATPMYVGKDGQYYRMTKDEISAWQTSKMNQLDENIDVSLDQGDEDFVFDDEGMSLGKIAGFAAILAGAGYWFMMRKKKA